MADTHVVLYEAGTGYVLAIWDTATHGSWSNSATWDTDGYIQLSTTGKVAQGFEDPAALGVVDTSGVGCVGLTNPTFDNSDWERHGVLEVDSAATPTDTQERSDGDKYTGDGYEYSA